MKHKHCKNCFNIFYSYNSFFPDMCVFCLSEHGILNVSNKHLGILALFRDTKSFTLHRFLKNLYAGYSTG